MIAGKEFCKERTELVFLLQKQGIKDKRVLAAIEKVPREAFVEYCLREFAYLNRPLPIGYLQTISQPFIVAFMTEAAELNKDSVVLEIGTGSGYQASVLAELSKEVFTVEIITELALQAIKVFKVLNYNNIHTKIGNGYEGWPEHAPYDAIIVTAASCSVPMKLIDQLAIGGIMIIPLEKEAGIQNLTKITKISSDNLYSSENLLDVRFVPMVNS